MIDHRNEEALKALPDDGPVTMLNLMRFRERSLDGKASGWDAYLRYPSRAAFLDMMKSADCAVANVERENGCADHTIIAVRETHSGLKPK